MNFVTATKTNTITMPTPRPHIIRRRVSHYYSVKPGRKLIHLLILTVSITLIMKLSKQTVKENKILHTRSMDIVSFLLDRRNHKQLLMNTNSTLEENSFSNQVNPNDNVTAFVQHIIKKYYNIKNFIISHNNSEQDYIDAFDTKEILNTCKDPGYMKTNIYLLKTHKTGSTTMRNILQRFSYKYNLTMPVFSETHPYPSRDLTKYLRPITTLWTVYQALYENNMPLNETMKDFLLHPTEDLKVRENQCNIMTRHSIFVKEHALKIFPSDVEFVANVRHPLTQMISANHQWNIPQHLGIPNNTNQVKAFLDSPEAYDKLLPALLHDTPREDKNTMISFTKNYIAFEFGFDLSKATDKSYVDGYMKEINSTFKNIIITERFVESLILMKRQMCWSFQDILFLKMRKSEEDNNTYSDQQLQNHRDWTYLDYEIYEMFLTRHVNLVREGGSLFQKELAAFAYVNGMVTDFCVKLIPDAEHANYTIEDYMDLAKDEVKIPATKFSEAFTMTGADCVMLYLHERKLGLGYIVHMYPQFCDEGFVKFLESIGIKYKSVKQYCKSADQFVKYNIPYSMMGRSLSK